MTELSSELLHASSVAIGGRAVLIEGLAGAGKSDLALRLIDRGAVLVSDDYTLVKRAGTGLTANAAPNIEGKIEVRGLGVVEMPNVDGVQVGLIVALGTAGERLPDDESRIIAGVAVAVVRIAGFEASAPIKVELAVKRIADG